MLLKITVQNDSPGTHEIGMTSGDMLSFDVAEIIGYESPLSATDENALGAYFASKYGLPFVPATAADILTFGLPGMPAVIDQSARTIAWTVPAGTDVEHLAPDYTMSPGATGYPESGVAQDFINPVQYTITGADGSTKVYVVTVTEAALAAPTGLAAVAGDATVSLDWNDTLEPGLASYRVYRSTTSGSGYEPIASGLAASAYTDIAVTNGVQYFYVVTAVNLGGGESAPSGEVFATPRGQAGTVNVNMGDVNADKSLNIADAISLLGYLFAQKAAPACAKSADANDDNALNIADAISILGYLFSGKTLKAPDGVELTSATHKGCAPYGAADIPAQVSGLPGCATQCAR